MQGSVPKDCLLIVGVFRNRQPVKVVLGKKVHAKKEYYLCSLRQKSDNICLLLYSGKNTVVTLYSDGTKNSLQKSVPLLGHISFPFCIISVFK